MDDPSVSVSAPDSEVGKLVKSVGFGVGAGKVREVRVREYTHGCYLHRFLRRSFRQL